MSQPRMLKLLAAFALVVGAAGCLPPPPGSVRYVEYAPPPPYYEVVGVAPGPGYLWVAGYWNWTGVEYVWVRGSWVMPPRGRTVWEPPGWERHPGRGWYMRRGHWR